MKKLNEGKTKIIYRMGDGMVLVENKDDVTAGDGKRHEVLEGKGALSSRMTANIFALLIECGFPVAFLDQASDSSFIARECEMLPLEVVVRRYSRGSLPKRLPSCPDGTRFDEPLVDLYLKTAGRRWTSLSGITYTLPCDDPYLALADKGMVSINYPSKPVEEGRITVVPGDKIVPDHKTCFDRVTTLARDTFLVLEDAYARLNAELDDFKVEFGMGTDGQLYIADVIDFDSMRLRYKGQSLDKQPFRDGEPGDATLRRFTLATLLTDNFKQVREQVVLNWKQKAVA